MAEPVNSLLAICGYIYYKTVSVSFHSVLYFPYNYHMVKEEKREKMYFEKYQSITTK